MEEQGQNTEVTVHQEAEKQNPRPEILEATTVAPPAQHDAEKSSGWTSWFK